MSKKQTTKDWKSPAYLQRTYKIDYVYASKLIKDIKFLLSAQKKEIIEKTKEGKICPNCGKDKESDLSVWCSECLENE